MKLIRVAFTFKLTWSNFHLYSTLGYDYQSIVGLCFHACIVNSSCGIINNERFKSVHVV
jgi:hypothetical protein